jgi:hypothetical protein
MHNGKRLFGSPKKGDQFCKQLQEITASSHTWGGLSIVTKTSVSEDGDFVGLLASQIPPPVFRVTAKKAILAYATGVDDVVLDQIVVRIHGLPVAEGERPVSSRFSVQQSPYAKSRR